MRGRTTWWVLALLLAFAAPAEARHGAFDVPHQASDTARFTV